MTCNIWEEEKTYKKVPFPGSKKAFSEGSNPNMLLNSYLSDSNASCAFLDENRRGNS